MIKFSSILLSFVVLFQSINFELCDLNKLHNFVVDANCHIQAGESFADFIADHYNEEVSSHDHEGDLHEHEDHGELPFKHQHVENNFQLVYLFSSEEYPIASEDFIVDNKNFCYKEPSTNLVLSSLFQPPRI